MEQDNKMTPGNLGIVFGPTLLRPRPTEATVSLSSLVDYPHQARIVETLITHYGLIFEEEPEEVPGGQLKVGAGPRAAPSERAGWDGEPWFQQARQEGPQRHLLSKELMEGELPWGKLHHQCQGPVAAPPPPGSGARPLRPSLSAPPLAHPQAQAHDPPRCAPCHVTGCATSSLPQALRT